MVATTVSFGSLPQVIRSLIENQDEKGLEKELSKLKHGYHTKKSARYYLQRKKNEKAA